MAEAAQVDSKGTAEASPVKEAPTAAGTVSGRSTGLVTKNTAIVVEPAAGQDEISEEVYLGVVKSYNDRRGFGFLACAETAMRYGRDVYMPKAEAAQAALEAAAADGDTSAATMLAALLEAAEAGVAEPLKAAAAAVAPKDAPEKVATDKPAEKPPPAPRLAEEDLVRFRVRLSIEGFPQAAAVKKLRKYTGTVTRVPPALTQANEEPEETGGKVGAIMSPGATAIHSHLWEVPVRRENCGQVRLAAGDEITFCVPEASDLLLEESDGAKAGENGSHVLEAKMVFLARTSRSNGSVLGCFTLDLPRTGAAEGAEKQPNLQLHCHAFGDKLILAGLPDNLEEAELLRFFSKQGASGVIVAHARACSFASVSFPSIVEVARFLGRVAHALADDKDTLMARLLDLIPNADIALLPALPAPTLSLGDEAGSLLVVWSPLVLAVAYSVDLRPAGVAGPWATVEVASTSPTVGNNRFDSNCSSCKVAGLNLGIAYEARVSYFTECGTRSEASEASEPCVTMLGASGAGSVATGGPLTGTPATPGAGLSAAAGFPPEKPSPAWGAPADLTAAYASPGAAPPMMPGQPPWPGSLGPEGLSSMRNGMPAYSDSFPSALPPYMPPSGWRSATGMIVPPPATPELRPADEFGFAVSVQWPAVLQACAYVVELREAGSQAFERFVRSAPEAKLGTVVELRVGGLRPGPPPGRIYIAQVRTVAADGSESHPSPPGVSPPLPPQRPGVALPGAAANPLQPSAAPSTSTLSADAAPWQPSTSYVDTATAAMAPASVVDPFSAPPTTAPGAAVAAVQQQPMGMGQNWAPPPWLGHLQPGGHTLGALGPGDMQLAGPSPGVLPTAVPSAAAGAVATVDRPLIIQPPFGVAPGPPVEATSPPPTAPMSAAPPGAAPGSGRQAPCDAPPEDGDAAAAAASKAEQAPVAPPEVTGHEECLILD